MLNNHIMSQKVQESNTLEVYTIDLKTSSLYFNVSIRVMNNDISGGHCNW